MLDQRWINWSYNNLYMYIYYFFWVIYVFGKKNTLILYFEGVFLMKIWSKYLTK